MICIFEHPSLALQACEPGSCRLGWEVSSSDPALWYYMPPDSLREQANMAVESIDR